MINGGTAPTTYRVSFENMRMGQNGSYTKVEEPGAGERFADGLIRFSPRQVTIPAGGAQTVRLMVRKPANLASGEYRSHLFFRSRLLLPQGGSIEDLDLKEAEISVTMIGRYAISIPVIVRHGKLSAATQFSDLSFTPATLKGELPHISVKLNRQGDRSVHGNLTVNFQSERSSDSSEVGRVNGIAIFVPNESRVLEIALYLADGVELTNGNLSVKFEGEKSYGVIAESFLAVSDTDG